MIGKKREGRRGQEYTRGRLMQNVHHHQCNVTIILSKGEKRRRGEEHLEINGALGA